jgi:hypothetical protein
MRGTFKLQVGKRLRPTCLASHRDRAAIRRRDVTMIRSFAPAAESIVNGMAQPGGIDRRIRPRVDGARTRDSNGWKPRKAGRYEIPAETNKVVAFS